MNALYSVMDVLLPFEWLGYTFMKNALLAMLLIAPLFGMLGTMAVDNKMAFFSDARTRRWRWSRRRHTLKPRREDGLPWPESAA